jgi:hypothetical protein
MCAVFWSMGHHWQSGALMAEGTRKDECVGKGNMIMAVK